MNLRSIVIKTAPLALLACSSPSPSAPALPESAALASPLSRFCADDNPCPGITEKKLEICGECDPSTRYFRRAICSLDNKVRKAVDSCVSARAGTTISGNAVFGGEVNGCVKQRLQNEPAVLKNFIAIARGHAAKADEQETWRTNCEQRWTAYRSAQGEAAGSLMPDDSGVGTLRLASKPAYAEVWLDGQRQRRVTPPQGVMEIVDLPAGEHELRLRYMDTDTLTTTVVVVADQDKTYKLQLERVPTCSSDQDCVGHEMGPRCDPRKHRCSCESADDCGQEPNTLCKAWWHRQSYNTCQAGLEGHYCQSNDQCSSGICKLRAVTMDHGRCAGPSS